MLSEWLHNVFWAVKIASVLATIVGAVLGAVAPIVWVCEFTSWRSVWFPILSIAIALGFAGVAPMAICWASTTTLQCK